MQLQYIGWQDAGSRLVRACVRPLATTFCSALLVVLASIWPAQSAFAAACPAGSDVAITVDNAASYCELCGVGQVTVRVGYSDNNNPDITHIVISEDLSGPGLVPVPNTTTVSVGNGPAPPAPAPAFSGGLWTWDFGNFLLEPQGQNPGNGQFLQITFQVRRANAVTEEGLFGASKAITSRVNFETDTDVCPVETTLDTLAFRAPNPNVIKLGRNVDANQASSQYTNIVHGHNNDDVIWRIQIQNTGTLAALQDVKFTDLMAAGNVDITYACPTEATATTLANQGGGGPIPAGCIPANNTLNDFEVVTPFGGPGTTSFPNGGAVNGFTRNLNGRDIDVAPSGTASIYLVGKLTADASCTSGGRNNVVSGVEFGCEADGNGVGGIPDTGATATLRTYHGDTAAQLTIARAFTGVNTVGTTTVSTQPLGARGLVTLTITNNTGGTVKEIFLDDVLPANYVVDPTYWTGGDTKTLPVRTTPIAGESSIRPAFNAYPGMIDRLTWENPQGSLTPPSQNPLQNTAPSFRLWSSTQHPLYPEQIHLLRAGDVLTVTFPVVLISQDRGVFEPYDLVGNLDVTPEVTADGTDPVRPALQSNQLHAEYDTFCTTQGNDGAGHFAFDYNTANINPFPEDIDVAITDINNNPASVMILTNDPNQQLPIRVRLTNNGGHSATNYQAFVSFGATMQVVTAPAGCVLITPTGSPLQPAPWKTWIEPNPIPANATVYHCTAPASIAPATTANLNFNVIKTNNAARIALDDLSLRADVVGEVVLHDGTPLWFPTPIVRPDGQLDRANDYTLDGVRQRVIGFNLIKTALACNENNPAAFEPGPNAKQAQRVEIGEECEYRVRTGGWFGFETPGFTLIEVRNVAVTDNLPTGQGYVSSTDPGPTSSPQIVGISLMGNPVPPTPNGLYAPGTPFTWAFNQSSPIDQLDEWFQANVTTRVLNNPVNVVAAPNQHALNSTNVLTSTFTAIFESLGVQTPYALGPSTVGYPTEPIRREDLKITEPRLLVVKEVCNETRYGVGPACTNFTTLADDGDAYNAYIYRLRVTNEAAANGIARSPAYDVTVTDTLDASGLACVLPFASDNLDNDADTASDGSDSDGEGSVASNCTVGVPAVVTFSRLHSTGLRRINPGASVTLYYRVDFDDDAAPQQTFTNSYTATYDSLAGNTNESSNQTVDPRPTGNIGGARAYTSAPAVARVQVIPVETQPKRITRTSHTAAPVPPALQSVVVGEEVEFELTTLLPVALLRNFVIRDELPPGLRCSEAPTINLDAPPYAAAGFQPGGTFTPTCTDTLVEWNFGNQRITQGTTPDNRFPFNIRFITRVENSATTNNAYTISNGAPATNVVARYINEANALVEYAFGQVSMVVREPLIALTKSFAPVVNADAADELTVTVTATNNGTSPAYNLRVFDDLTAGVFSYVGNVGGANVPTVDTALLGSDRPVFSYPAGYAIAPGASVSFTFVVRVEGVPEPHKVLANTLYAAWTSLPDTNTALNAGGQIGADGSATGMRIGALPNAGDAINDYETLAAASVSVPALALTKTDLDPALPPAIGAHKPFRIVVDLPEGTTNNLAIADNLYYGAVSYVLADNAAFDVTYEFIGIDTINGETPDAAAFMAVPADAANGTVTWSIGNVVTQTENDYPTGALTPSIRINYFARINNDTVTDAGDVLRNSVDATYRNGETGATQTLTYAAAPITAIEPTLSSTKELSNVTPGKQPTDPLALNDVVQYVVTIVNAGSATAFDVNIVDTLPLELMLDTNYTPTAAINGTPVAGFVGTPAGAPAGPLVWGRGNGDGSLDLPAGAYIELTYNVVVRAAPDTTTGLANRVWTDWTSLNAGSTYERTGAGCPTTTAPNDYCYGPAVAIGSGVPAPPPTALAKAYTQPSAAVGEIFRYTITVPAVAYPFALYDVRITDDLAASAADMRFIGATKISGSTDWTPVNTGTATNVVIEDTANGIDIPANEQIVLEISVQLTDTPTNVSGLTFTNTASYLFNRIDNNAASQRPGLPGTTQPMTIVGPDTLTLEKSGPANMTIGTGDTFTLNVHNLGTGRAWDLTIVDRLPQSSSTSPSGMCETAPSGFTAQLYQADGTTTVGAALVEGTDFSATFTPAPDCLLHITALTPAAAIPSDHRLIVRYQAYLDLDSERNAALTNVAGATEWFSADRSNPTYADEVRTFTGTLTDGTPGVLDYQDAYTTNVDLPLLRFEKTVVNLTTSENPGRNATPTDTLRYHVRIENLAADPIANFTFRDELDRLNTAQGFGTGTLTLLTVPTGADSTNTDPAGGVHNAGLVDIRNLSLGGLNSYIEIEYQVRPAPVLPNLSYIQNQAQVLIGTTQVALSDDPTVNGAADPLVAGDEDPTRVQIHSAPYFRVQKISTDLDGNPAVLLAGERLRYTITVKNIGTDNAVDARLRDALPLDTTYIPGSTTLNGTTIADAAGNTLPLTAGIDLYAPENTTPGAMRADASTTTANVATVTFEVRVDPLVANQTVISNQGYVSAVAGGVVDQPSDDPRTPVANDPTRNVVGNYPLLFAEKSAVLQVDNDSPGIVDPTDYLLYTIKVYNNGNIAGTMARLVDEVPNDTTYVADTLTLNGLPVGQPDNGVFPLADGIWISTSDLTPPLPGPNEGTLSPHESATVTFQMRVNDATPRGTQIVNQATVSTAEVASRLTDGDGNPATGPEPTVVVVGDAQVLTITKEVMVVGGGPAIAGATLDYLVTVRNPSAVPATDVYVSDNLDETFPGYLLYVDQSAMLNNSANGVSVAGAVITANFSTVYGPLMPGQSFQLRFRAQIAPTLAIGTQVTNVAHVTWNTDQTAYATNVIDVGGMVGSGILNGNVWHDSNFDDVLDPNERVLEGWTVELRRNDQPIASTTTDSEGAWRISGVVPNYLTQNRYDLFFRAPGASASSALLGRAASAFTNGLQHIYDIQVLSGSNLQDLNLPIDPDGIVYNSISREPQSGMTVTMLDAGSGIAVAAACFDDPNQQGQVTRSDGYYKFDINFSDPSCQSGASYRLEVVPPAAGFETGLSRVIPPVNDPLSAFDVPNCPGGAYDAIPMTATYCEVQPSEFAPPLGVPARSAGTAYRMNIVLDDSRVPGSKELYNNHIAVDPTLSGVVLISKTTPMVDVTRGQMVPYTITVRNTWQFPLTDINVVDRYPTGFKYIEGSARFDNQPLEPTVGDRQLLWQDLTLDAESEHTIQLLLAPGAGVTEGKFTNYAQSYHNLTGQALSGEASATVRVVSDPTFDCTDVTGKVFDDANRNGTQDAGETGIAGARLVAPTGLAATTDDYGRFHITCAITPREGRGSNFMLKLDDRTLPTGYRGSTDEFQIKRATRGKALHFSFGASIHRVIGLEVADGVFMPDSTEMRPQWTPRVDLLLEELQKGPAVLRLTYLADVEDPKVVERRVDAMTKLVSKAWADLDGSYRLVIEHEVFWRTGKPPSSDPRHAAMREGEE